MLLQCRPTGSWSVGGSSAQSNWPISLAPESSHSGLKVMLGPSFPGWQKQAAWWGMHSPPLERTVLCYSQSAPANEKRSSIGCLHREPHSALLRWNHSHSSIRLRSGEHRKVSSSSKKAPSEKKQYGSIAGIIKQNISQSNGRTMASPILTVARYQVTTGVCAMSIEFCNAFPPKAYQLIAYSICSAHQPPAD